MAHPFLKWAGGRRQLLPILEQNLPAEMADLTTYIEPFIGGGAMLFRILEMHDFDEVHISDVNPELTLCYSMIKSDASGVFDYLRELIDLYPQEQEARKEVFYGVRAEWNSKLQKSGKLGTEQKIKRGSSDPFLNKTCFNGLFRLNEKGVQRSNRGYVRPSFRSRMSYWMFRTHYRGFPHDVLRAMHRLG